MGVLERYSVEKIGADAHAIDKAEDRALFREAMHKIGLETPKSMLANATAAKDADRKKHEAERVALRRSKLARHRTPITTRMAHLEEVMHDACARPETTSKPSRRPN